MVLLHLEITIYICSECRGLVKPGGLSHGLGWGTGWGLPRPTPAKPAPVEGFGGLLLPKCTSCGCHHTSLSLSVTRLLDHATSIPYHDDEHQHHQHQHHQHQHQHRQRQRHQAATGSSRLKQLGLETRVSSPGMFFFAFFSVYY